MTLDHCRPRKINVQVKLRKDTFYFTTFSLPGLTVHPIGLPKWYKLTSYSIGLPSMMSKMLVLDAIMGGIIMECHFLVI